MLERCTISSQSTAEPLISFTHALLYFLLLCVPARLTGGTSYHQEEVKNLSELICTCY